MPREVSHWLLSETHLGSSCWMAAYSSQDASSGTAPWGTSTLTPGETRTDRHQTLVQQSQINGVQIDVAHSGTIVCLEVCVCVCVCASSICVCVSL